MIMPELEPCSQCGKQVLVSRYAWNKNQVICLKCTELNMQQKAFNTHNQASNYSSLSTSQLNLSLKESQVKLHMNKQFDKADEEILITWPSLLKISFGSLLTLLLIIFGFMSWRNSTKILGPSQMPEDENLLIKN